MPASITEETLSRWANHCIQFVIITMMHSQTVSAAIICHECCALVRFAAAAPFPFVQNVCVVVLQAPFAQIRENNWSLNTDLKGNWSIRYDLWWQFSCYRLTVDTNTAHEINSLKGRRVDAGCSATQRAETAVKRQSAQLLPALQEKNKQKKSLRR